MARSAPQAFSTRSQKVLDVIKGTFTPCKNLDSVVHPHRTKNLKVEYKLRCKYLYFTLHLILLSTLFLSGQSWSSKTLASGRFVVSFVATDKQQAWVAEALEQNVYNDMSGYERIIPVAKTNEWQSCPKRNTNCLLKLYADSNIDALMLGEVKQKKVKYAVYNLHNRSLVKSGSFSIKQGSTLISLRMAAFNGFRSFLASGGILERKKYLRASPESATAPKPVVNNSSYLSPQILLGVFALITLLPYFYSFLGNQIKHPHRLKILLRYFFPYIFICFITFVGVFVVIEDIELSGVEAFKTFWFDLGWLHKLLTGCIWGYFVAVNLRFILPHTQSLERISQRNILPLLSSYLVTIMVKLTLFVAAYSIIFQLTLGIGRVFELESSVVKTVLFPLFSLYFLYWFALILEVFAMSLDVRLSNRKLEQRTLWSTKLKKYFESYIKRSGNLLDDQLVKNIQLISGNNQGVYCYGGILSPARISVNQDMLQKALGDRTGYLTDYIYLGTKQSNVHSYSPSLLPNFAQKKIKRFTKSKTEKSFARIHQLFTRNLCHYQDLSASQKDKITQGLVLPSFAGKEDLPSLMADNLPDMRVVEELMLEDTVRSDPFDEEAEVDDSHEEDKDFLFGILLQKFGEILRYDHLLSTIKLYLQSDSKKKPKPYRFPFGRHFSRVADTFTVTNFAQSHFMQYLYFRASDNDQYLTTRGSSERLLESQNCILTDLKAEAIKRKEQFFYADYYERLTWLSRFCEDRVNLNKGFSLTKYLAVLLIVSVLYFLFMALFTSYQYRDTYNQIIDQEEKYIAERIKKMQAKLEEKND